MTEDDVPVGRKHVAWVLLLVLLLACLSAAYLTGWPVSLLQNHGAAPSTPIAGQVQQTPAPVASSTQTQSDADEAPPPQLGKSPSSGSSAVPAPDK